MRADSQLALLLAHYSLAYAMLPPSSVAIRQIRPELWQIESDSLHESRQISAGPGL